MIKSFGQVNTITVQYVKRVDSVAVVKLSSNRQAWFYTNSTAMPTSRKGSQGCLFFPTSPLIALDEGVATVLICGSVATTDAKCYHYLLNGVKRCVRHG